MVLSHQILARTFLASAVSLSGAIGFSTLASAEISEQYFVYQTLIDSSQEQIPSDLLSFSPFLEEFLDLEKDSDLSDQPFAIATSDSNTVFDDTINGFIGNLEVAGLAKLFTPQGLAIAESEAVTNFESIVANPNSTIKIHDLIIAIGLGDARGGEARNSISFLVEDLETDETLLEGVFLDLYANLQGTLELDDVARFTGVTDGVFSIKLNNPFINTSGSLLAEFKNGILTTSNDSGIFDGLLPSVGSTGTFSFSVPEIIFSYDLPDFGEDILFSLNTRIGGRARVAVPEPLTILGSGTAIGFAAFFKRKLSQNKEK